MRLRQRLLSTTSAVLLTLSCSALDQSDFLTIAVTVPESHADRVREAIVEAGGGYFGSYSHCSFLTKGIGRFKPESGTSPFIGVEGKVESVVEERIETICSRDCLEQVIQKIKEAHPYEKTYIAIFPIYQCSIKE